MLFIAGFMVQLLFLSFFLSFCVTCFVSHTQKRTQHGKKYIAGGGQNERYRQRLRCVHAVKQAEAAAAGSCSCTGEIRAWLLEAESVDLGITHLDSYQGSAGFQAPLYAMFGRGALVFPLVAISGLSRAASETLSLLFFSVRSENFRGASHPLLHFPPAFSHPVCVCVLFLIISLCVSLVSLTEVRSEERGMLERAGVVQSFTVGVAPIVVVISSVCTFTLHMAMGYDLTAAEVFKYGSVRVSCMIYRHSTVGNRLSIFARASGYMKNLNSSASSPGLYEHVWCCVIRNSQWEGKTEE